jgi:hypothetical protein
VPDWVPVLTGSLIGLGAILNAILIYRRQGQTLGVSQEDSVTRRLQLDLDTLKGQIALYEAWVKGMSEQLKSKDEQIKGLVIERDASRAELALIRARGETT